MAEEFVFHYRGARSRTPGVIGARNSVARSRPNLITKCVETSFIRPDMAFGGVIARAGIEETESDRIDRPEPPLQNRQAPAVDFDGRGCGRDFSIHGFKDSGNSGDWKRGL